MSASELPELTTIAVTLGHTGLTCSVRDAEEATRRTLGREFVELCYGIGSGSWEADNGETLSEANSFWLGTIPTTELPVLRWALAKRATTLRQEAIGLIVHDHATQEQSYIRSTHTRSN